MPVSTVDSPPLQPQDYEYGAEAVLPPRVLKPGELLVSAGEQVFLSPFDRLQYDSGEPALCTSIGLSPKKDGSGRCEVELLVLDVGFGPKKEGATEHDLDGYGHKQRFEHQYALVRRTRDDKGRPVNYLVEFDADQEIDLSRHGDFAEALGYDDNKYISRQNHAKFSINKAGVITLSQADGKNPTLVRGLRQNLDADQDDGQSAFDYTKNIADYVSNANQSKQLNKSENTYGGRPIISRDKAINQGVYPVGGTDGEALVVDDKKYGEVYQTVWQELGSRLERIKSSRVTVGALQRLVRSRGGANETMPVPTSSSDSIKWSLEQVFDTVLDFMEYDAEKVNDFNQQQGINYHKIELTAYIKEGVGVCRHQALLAAYLVERLVRDGHSVLAGGRVSIDRNVKREVDGKGYGHAWARYMAPNGEVFIIDPAQKFVGTLAESVKDQKTWDYRRTTDLIRQCPRE